MAKKKYESRVLTVPIKPVIEYLVYPIGNPGKPMWTMFKHTGYPTKEQAIKAGISDVKARIKETKADLKDLEKVLANYNKLTNNLE